MMMNGEHNRLMNGWYWNPDVQRVMLSSMGYNNNEIYRCVDEYKKRERPQKEYSSIGEMIAQENNDLYPIVRKLEDKYAGTEPETTKLSQSRNLRNALENVMSAYVQLKTQHRPSPSCNGYVPAPITDARPDVETLANTFIDFENPPVEVHQSPIGRTVAIDGDEWPARILFNLDVEVETPQKRHMEEYSWLFNQVEKARLIIEDMLIGYGIPYTCIMTGRGYHFVSQIMSESDMMRDMVKCIKLDHSVLERLKSDEVYKKIGCRVPENSEKAFRMIGRLQQFAFNKVKKRIAANADIPVDVLKRNDVYISLDNTATMRTCDFSTLRAFGSIYTKFFDEGGRIIAPLIKDHNGVEWVKISEGTEMRAYVDAALKQFRYHVGYIPEGSEGLKNMLEDYRKSNLHDLHDAMEKKDHVDMNITGFNTALILGNENRLNDFVFERLNKGWHPKDISSFLLSAHKSHYRDPYCDIGRHYDGYVEIIIGQRFEEQN